MTLCVARAQFMDEPTSGLDARSAATVMQAVRNIAANGRTVMVTIHQPSIEIFEAFDRLVLLAPGGHAIFSGALGEQSKHLIDFFRVRRAGSCVSACRCGFDALLLPARARRCDPLSLQ